ncbi:F-actin-capping protein, partial [Lobulomyces angularis]
MSKEEISNEILLSSPPGEINDVFNDLRVLINDDTLLQNLKPTFANYNKSNLVFVNLPESNPVLITPFNELDNGSYFDPRTNQSFDLDHMTHAISNIESITKSEKFESIRKVLDDSILEYTNEHFPEGVSGVFETVENGGEIIVCISDSKFNPNNYWNAKWQSLYTLSIDTKKLVGEAKVLVHYYEDGNVQLNVNRTLSINLDYDLDQPETVSTSTLKEILKFENSFQNTLNESYSKLTGNAFKNLRRPLPIFSTKIDWNTISS